MNSRIFDRDKRAKLLRKAAYWLTDYANCFRHAPEPGAVEFRKKIRAIAAKCREASRRHD